MTPAHPPTDQAAVVEPVSHDDSAGPPVGDELRQAVARGLHLTWQYAKAVPGSQRALGAIVVVQAAWYAVLCSRGWFFNDDFNFMAQTAGHSLNWAYLTLPVNVHLAPGLRLVFWLSVHGEHLHYWPSIVWRVGLQALATVLLYRLLVALTDSVRGALVVTAGYAFCPLLIPATLYFASAVNQVPSQLLVLVALHCCVRYDRGRRLGWAVLCGLSLLLAACFWEKTAIDGALVVVLLRIGWLTPGSLWARVRSLGRDVLGWLAMLGLLVVFFGYFLSHGYGQSTHRLALASALHLGWEQWSRSLWPSVVGGPWHWYSVAAVFDSVSNPRLPVIVLGQVAFGLLLLMGWRRTRWHGLFAWLLPLSTVFIGEAIVAIGRYSLLGNLTALDFHYAADVAVPTAIGVALACFAPPARGRAVAAEPAPASRWRSRTWVRRLQVSAIAALIMALLASAVVSDLKWDNRFVADPAHSYMTNLLDGVGQLPPGASIYNTTAPLAVLPFLENNRQLSDLIALSGKQVAFDGNYPPPEIADITGHLRPAVFYVVSDAVLSKSRVCPRLIQGIQTVRLRLNATVGGNQYFLRVEYYQKRPTALRVTVNDTDGAAIPAVGNDEIGAESSLGAALIALTSGRPATVTITSDSAATNICLTGVQLGLPLVASP